MDNILELISLDRIKIIEAGDKESALKEIVGLFSNTKSIKDLKEVEKAILEREKVLSTSIGIGIGIPHVRLESATEMVIAVGVCKEGIDYDSFDGQPVKIILMIVSPAGSHREYLKLLAQIALFLKNPSRREKILKAENQKEIYAALKGL